MAKKESSETPLETKDLDKNQTGKNERTDSVPSSPSVDEQDLKSQSQENQNGTRTSLQKVWSLITYTPKRCRWDPDHPPVFSMPMNVLFGFAGAFTVANLYYNHPILNIFARDFNVSYETASDVPTLMQTGYAAGLLFLCPLGDMLKRRAFVLTLVFFTATMWIGLCITKSFVAFEVISFITAITTVTPQLMLPLVGDLAPPQKRATALSIVTAGNILGILIARLFSGIVAQYTTWRAVYWLALGLQYLIFSLLWLFMPDYPPTNPGGFTIKKYLVLLVDVLRMIKKHPVLVQASLISMATAATFTSFWTVLTFLLADPPYNYNPVSIGLFALIGIAGMCMTPIFARLVIDKYVPLFSVLAGELMNLVGIAVGTFSGLYSPAGPGIQAWLTDMGMQTAQIANRSAIYAVEPQGRNRVNTVFMVFTFIGQLMGTAVGNRLYAQGQKHHCGRTGEGCGWIWAGSMSLGFIGLSFALVAVRGPWERGWIGWTGGWSMVKKDKLSADGMTRENVTLGGHGNKDYGKDVTAESLQKEIDVEKQQVAAEDINGAQPERRKETEPHNDVARALEESAEKH